MAKEKASTENPQQTEPAGKTHKGAKPLSLFGRIWYYLLLGFFLIFATLSGLILNSVRDLKQEEAYIGLIFVSCLIVATIFCAYRLFVPDKRQLNFGGFSTIFLIIMAFVAFGSLSIIPQFNKYCCRAYDPDAKANLHNLYLGCKAYWHENGSENLCSVSIASQPEIGYVKSDRVNIEGYGTESTFTATAQHMDSTTQYTMDANGEIR